MPIKMEVHISNNKNGKMGIENILQYIVILHEFTVCYNINIACFHLID